MRVGSGGEGWDDPGAAVAPGGLANRMGLSFPICEVGLMSVLPETKISSFLKPLRKEEDKKVTGFVHDDINLCQVIRVLGVNLKKVTQSH